MIHLGVVDREPRPAGPELRHYAAYDRGDGRVVGRLDRPEKKAAR